MAAVSQWLTVFLRLALYARSIASLLLADQSRARKNARYL
jgi:hypothetical protein